MRMTDRIKSQAKAKFPSNANQSSFQAFPLIEYKKTAYRGCD